MVNRTGSLTQRSERLLSRENKQHSVQPKKCESKPMSVLGIVDLFNYLDTRQCNVSKLFIMLGLNKLYIKYHNIFSNK